MIRWRWRETWRPWPFRITVTESGHVTWGIRIWRYSWSQATGKSAFRLPAGLGRLEWGGKRGRRGRGAR